MAYNKELAERIRVVFAGRRDIIEKKMFGGIAFMLAGNMCCGVANDDLMARVGPAKYEQALSQPYAREMDFTGKPLTGFVYVSPKGIESANDLEFWIAWCTDFVESLPAK